MERKFKRSLKTFGCDFYKEYLFKIFAPIGPMLAKMKNIPKHPNIFFFENQKVWAYGSGEARTKNLKEIRA